MASIIEQLYGTANQAITCTLTSLANGGARQSTAIDNTSALFFSAKVFLKIKSGSSSVSATGTANLYVYETADAGTTYSDGATGSDGSITLTAPPNMRLVGVLNMVANSTTYEGCFTINDLPQKWGIVIVNNSGAAFDGTTAAAWYQGVQQQAT